MTPQDPADWLAWRKTRKLAQHRERRAKLRRIDYQPSPEGAAITDSLCGLVGPFWGLCAPSLPGSTGAVRGLAG